ncbi:MAG TPA: hypothetical protein VGP81_06815 [Pyrinomonadaceae bacterium]|jgi:hypothetical protein|nr:hypothetical protein [Pyrinomonadaceae bacterium]
MKRLFVLAAFVFIAAIAANAQNKANFAGSWSLDKAKSQGLSQRMQGADKVTWTITQDDKTISIDSKVEGGQPPAGGGAGGGGGTGGGRGMGGPQSYNLDGSEATSDVGGGQMTGKATSKATWAGNDLNLSRTSVFQGPNGEITSVTTQKLSLSGDGKVLTAVVHSESPRGTTDSTLVFNKQ